uniref:Uncharacterized protein n=1 Tax=Arundo donax TaxID=35708 RepID=A0A0A8Z1Y9_ARUDO
MKIFNIFLHHVSLPENFGSRFFSHWDCSDALQVVMRHLLPIGGAKPLRK